MLRKKVHASVTRSLFRSQNVKSTSVSERFCQLSCSTRAHCCAKHMLKSNVQSKPVLEQFWKFRCPKQITRMWPGAHFEVMKSTYQKHLMLGAGWEVEMFKQSEKTHVRITFGRSSVILRGRGKELCTLHLAKGEQNVRVL